MRRRSVECEIGGRPHVPVRATPSSTTSRRPDIRRLYAALIFIPVLYVIVRYLPPAALFGLVLVVMLLALTEFYRMYFAGRGAVGTIALGLGLAGLLLVSLQWPGTLTEQMVVLLAVCLALISRLYFTVELSRSLVDAAVLVFGMLYVAFPLGHLLLTRTLPDGIFLIFFVLLVTWAGDTGAYYAGVSMGHRKLAPLVSPNKTVEGLIGGLCLALLATFAARFWFVPSLTITDCLATGLLLTIAGVSGDLCESALKRSAGVKDSGHVIPGHGGMLDRIDSLLFTAPTFYYYMTLVKG